MLLNTCLYYQQNPDVRIGSSLSSWGMHMEVAHRGEDILKHDY